MSMTCSHLGIDDYPLANDTCREALEMTYECIANEVLKTRTSKHSTIVMAASKQFLADHLLKSPVSGEIHHLVGSFLEMVIDKFSTLAAPNCLMWLSSTRQSELFHSSSQYLSNSSTRRGIVEFAIHGMAHTTSVLEIDCLASKLHIAILPPNSVKRCWTLHAIIGTMCNAKFGIGKHSTLASTYKGLMK